MPTYEYECDACKNRFDEFQSFSEERLTKCPKCKKKKLRRLLGSGSAIIFKGSGFYETDYRSESYKKAAQADADAAKPAEAAKPADAAKPAEAGTAGKTDTSGGGSAKKSKGSDGKNSKSKT